MSKLKDLEARHTRAKNILRDLELARNKKREELKLQLVKPLEDKVAEARCEVDEKINHEFRLPLHEAWVAEQEAERAYEAERVAQSSANGLVGRRFRRWSQRRRGMEQSVFWASTDDVGEVAVYDGKTVNLRAMGYFSRPSVGDLILQFVKKDGKLGKTAHCRLNKLNGEDVVPETWFPVGVNPNEEKK